MDENRPPGTAKSAGGKVEDGATRGVTGEIGGQAHAVADQALGAAQELYGQARDIAAEGTGAVRASATSLEKWLRTTIETQPYTAAIAALGIGWFLGRMHRPL